MTGSPTVAAPTASVPRARWSDLWKAPLHDFPIRDEILYQHWRPRRDSDVLEIGPGSGFTAFCLARHARTVTLVDVADEAVRDLQRRLRHCENVRCLRADVTMPDFLDRIEGAAFDAAFALDVFEYVTDPAACLRHLAAALRPGGELFVTYPNVPPPEGDGVTYFTHAGDLERLLATAGFSQWTVFCVRPRPWAAFVYRLLHEIPLRAYRRLRRDAREGNPQTYEATWAFQHRQRLEPYKLALHLLWLGLGSLMRLRGPIFIARPAADGILGRQVVIRAWK